MKQYLIPFLVSMVPLIELRGAIPIAQGMGLPILPSYIVCIVSFVYSHVFLANHCMVRRYLEPLIGREHDEQHEPSRSHYYSHHDAHI